MVQEGRNPFGFDELCKRESFRSSHGRNLSPGRTGAEQRIADFLQRAQRRPQGPWRRALPLNHSSLSLFCVEQLLDGATLSIGPGLRGNKSSQDRARLLSMNWLQAMPALSQCEAQDSTCSGSDKVQARKPERARRRREKRYRTRDQVGNDYEQWLRGVRGGRWTRSRKEVKKEAEGEAAQTYSGSCSSIQLKILS